MKNNTTNRASVFIIACLGLLSACGSNGGGGGASNSSNTPSDQPDTSTEKTEAPFEPNFVNFANVTLSNDGDNCYNYCYQINNGDDVLEGRIRIHSFGVIVRDVRTINGEFAGYSNNKFNLLETTAGNKLYFAGVYSENRGPIGLVSPYPSAYYSEYDMTEIYEEIDANSRSFLPINTDAQWSWENVFNQVAINNSENELDLITDENGTITLNPDQSWEARFANGDLILEGHIDGDSYVSGSSSFTYQRENMFGNFVGGDGLRENGRFETGGVFAGGNSNGTLVYAGNWYDRDESMNNLDQSQAEEGTTEE